MNKIEINLETNKITYEHGCLIDKTHQSSAKICHQCGRDFCYNCATHDNTLGIYCPSCRKCIF
jgi:hypothetical protein